MDYGTSASVDLTVRIKNGLYQESENRDLSYSNVGKITIIGESYGNVIIDAEHAKSGTGWWASGSNIFTFGQNLEIALVNLTLINCDGRPVDAYALTMNDNIVINSSDIRAQSPNGGVFIDNLKVINGTGQAINAYNLVLTNSLFENCNGGSSTGLLWLAANNDNVIRLENNTFIGNTIAGYSGGAAYYAQGDLVSINNTFDSNTVTGSASNIAYASGNNITSINDKFINNEVTSYVAQYRSSGSNPTEIIVENITFINNKASTNGAGLVTNGAKIKGGKFINNTAAGNGGAISLLNHGSTSQVTEMSIEDVTFEDNTAASGNDIFIAPGSGSNVFVNLNNLTITANSQNVTELSDIITVTVSHPSGAIIGGGQVTFYFNGSVVGKADLINQNATLEYVGFKNDTVYDFTSVYEYATENDTYVGGVVSTNIADTVDSIEFYVSNSTGDDVNGNGSENNPFKSISRALSEGYTKSTNITVHVLEGNYTGDLNTELRIPTTVDVTIVGEDADKVIITDSDADYFITALAGNSKLTLANVTVNRAARDTQSAIYIEEGANVEIDNVKFIGGQGNYGGAINTAGTLVVNNSYFFDNGYGDVSKRANAYYGGAIYNDGILIIDNSTFEANHAGRLSTIANQGTLYMSNSKVTDSLNAYAMNMDLVAIGAFGGQKGNITIENSIFTVTNRTVDELSDRIYMPQNSLTCLAIGSSEHVTIINSSFENEGGIYTPNAFGGLNSWNLAGGGYTMVTGDVEVYNSTFRNLQSVSLFYTRTDGSSYHSHRVFDGCLFENVEYLIAVVNSGENLTVAIHNSVILSDNATKIGVAAGKTIDMDISDNWWGSNNATYGNATISTSNFLSNYVLKIREISSEIVNPENFLVLTLNATNKTGLVQDITLAFKVSDGENVTDYNGTLRPCDYVMSATNGTLAVENGTIDNAVVTAFEGTENQGYYVEATVDGQTVNLTVEEPLTLGNATILAEDIELAYNQTQINVTVLEGTQPATGNITLKVNNKTYTVDIIDGVATFDIEVLVKGNYTLEYSIDNDKVYNPVSNSSALTVTPFDANMTVDADDISIGTVGIDVTLPADATGNITVTVNSSSKTVEVKDGKASATFANLTPGNYDISVVYSGDDKYNADSETSNVAVTNVVNNETFSKFFDENGTLSDEFAGDELVFEGEISNQSTNLINIDRPITLSGNDATLDNIAINITSNDVTVDGFTIKADEIPYAINVEDADNVVIANNTIDFIDNGTDNAYAIFANGADNLTVSGNDISFEGNTSGSTVNNAVYIGNSENVAFENNTVSATLPSSYVPWAEVPVGSGNWVSSPVSEGLVFDNCSDLSVKDNDIEVDYDGVVGSYDTIYAVDVKNSDNAVIEDNTIDATGNTYIYGLIVSGDNFTIANNDISSISDSYYANGIDIEGPASGNIENNNITATAPSVAYPVYSAMSNGDVAVNYTDNTIVGEADTVYAMQLGGAEENVIGNDITATGNHTTGIDSKAKQLTVKDNNIVSNGDLEDSTDVGITVSSGNYDIENNTIETTGDYTVKAPNAGEGTVANNNLTAAELTGDASVIANENATVTNNTPSMTRAVLIVDDIVMYYKNGTRLVAYLVDQFGNPIANQTVVFSINGMDYVRTTAADGIASIALRLNVGVYNATVTFNATEPYSGDEKLSTVTILSTINGTDVTKVFRNGTQYYATFVDGQGNPLANGTMVRFNIHGVMYDRKVNENGTAKLNINLAQGTYILTAIHPDTGEMASNTITVLPKITENSDLVKYFKNDSQYVVRLIGDDGNPVGAGETVTFNINGVMYERKTNASGYAKLNINLGPGDYIIQFKASLVDGQGNPYAGQNITFNINGIFYNRTTDAQGIAKLNINLMAGEYIITSMYNDAAISNKITIRA